MMKVLSHPVRDDLDTDFFIITYLWDVSSFFPFSICYLISPQKEKLLHSVSIHRVFNQDRLSDPEIVERYNYRPLNHSIHLYDSSLGWIVW